MFDLTAGFNLAPRSQCTLIQWLPRSLRGGLTAALPYSASGISPFLFLSHNHRRALSETIIVGLVTNAQFLLQVLDHEIFAAGRANTHFIQNHLPAPEVLRLLTAPLPDDIVTEGSFLHSFRTLLTF